MKFLSLMFLLLPTLLFAQEELPAMSIDIDEYHITKQIQIAKVGDKLRLKNLNFYGGTDKITTESEPELNKLIDILNNKPTLKIEIQGHICCYNEAFNELSHQRAAAVYRYLAKHGISKKRLAATGFGGSRPIHKIPEKDEWEREANRRVEIEIKAI
jgi:outer membrane protein OmpA-like peptidoglycan-associated protein